VKAIIIILALGVVGCAQVAGIEEKPCRAVCVNATTRLVCEGGASRAEACPASPEECAAVVCTAGTCGYAPAIGNTCGPEGTGRCNEGYACVGEKSRLSAIFAHTCLVADDGKVWCWGTNKYAELGDGTSEPRGNPVLVRGLPGAAIDVAVGYGHTCALLADGDIYCWGNNEAAQCGTGGPSKPLTEPVRVPAGEIRFTAVAAGQAHACAIAEDRSVYCWGWTIHGITGVDTSDVGGALTIPPRRVEGLDDVKGIETVKNHTCAVRYSTPTMVCWGSNMQIEKEQIAFKLGPGAVDSTGTPLEYSATPVPVDIGREVRDIGMGWESTYAVGIDSVAFAWGYNRRSQLGTGNEAEYEETPEPILREINIEPYLIPLTGVRDILRSDGSDQCAELNSALGQSRYVCWGRDGFGEIGLGEVRQYETFPFPVETVLPQSARNLVRGENHGCALVTIVDTHEVWCYGAGELVANGTTTSGDPEAIVPPQPKPTPIVWNPDNFASTLERVRERQRAE
jgi:alpha-tubulin suppressor-like RCC1 family protein